MDIGMRAGLGMTVAVVSLSVIILVAVVGTKESKEFASVLEKQKPEIQKINELITATLKSDATITCTKSGGIYKYEVTIKDLGVKFRDDRNPHREITVMPVLSYKDKKSLDLKKSSLVLKSGDDKTFNAEEGIEYTITSTEPPTIFKDDKIYHGYLLKDQRIVINDYDISIIDQSLVGSITVAEILAGIPASDAKCTVAAQVQCYGASVPERKILKFTECEGDDKKLCDKSVSVCGSSLTMKLLEFRNKDVCSKAKPVFLIDTSEKLQPLFAPEKKEIDPRLKEKFVIGFCGKVSDAYDCNFIPDKTDFYGPMFIEVKPGDYSADDCIESAESGI
ncbi:MAG: hypothetical protein HYW26_03155 [Candidatus Aenigmarchaeota archaeon]|nr:hypothetical protein [Candidatus Aenigmarchaeota archaeon]